MRAVIFLPVCCEKARLAADLLRLSTNVRMVLDNYLCGKVDVDVAVKEIVQLCRKADGRRSQFGWTLTVQDCEWDDVEDVVAEVGGDVVYVPR
jgi:poly(A) polymerase Pap1